jgi:hypothetical protein
LIEQQNDLPIFLLAETMLLAAFMYTKHGIGHTFIHDFGLGIGRSLCGRVWILTAIAVLGACIPVAVVVAAAMCSSKHTLDNSSGCPGWQGEGSLMRRPADEADPGHVLDFTFILSTTFRNQ